MRAVLQAREAARQAGHPQASHSQAQGAVDPTREFIAKMERQLAQFTPDTENLTVSEEEKFTEAFYLLSETSAMYDRRRPSVTDGLDRAKAVLKRVFNDIGPEAFLLCALASVSAIIDTQDPGLFGAIATRWARARAEYPKAFTRLANMICEVNAIGCLTTMVLDFPLPNCPPDMQSYRVPCPRINITPRHSKHRFISSPDDVELHRATPRGFHEVFGQYFSDVVRWDPVEGVDKMQAAMVFSTVLPEEDCLVRICVREEAAQQLALALFNTRVKWDDEGLHINEGYGYSLLVNSTGPAHYHLIGAWERAIYHVFGPLIVMYMTESRRRQKEVDELQLLTDCLGMTFEGDGAVITLVLNVELGKELLSHLLE